MSSLLLISLGIVRHLKSGLIDLLCGTWTIETDWEVSFGPYNISG
jgi:hypothetical protein